METYRTVLGLSSEGFHRLAYTEWGRHHPDHPAIICLHGLLRNRHDFDALARYLNHHGRHVFCPDLAGRGDSDWFHSPSHYTNEQYMADMSSLIARTGSSRIDWIGTSLGGIIGMMLAALPNTPIHRLILNDVGAQIPLHGLRRLAKYVNVHPEFSNKEEAIQYYQTIYHDFGTLTPGQWDELTTHNIKPLANGHFVAKGDPNLMHHKTKIPFLWELMSHPHKALQGIMYDIDLWSVWEKITCPVLIIHGRQSDLLLEEHIVRMKKIHPLTEVMVIDDAGHAPALLRTTEHESIAQWLG